MTEPENKPGLWTKDAGAAVPLVAVEIDGAVVGGHAEVCLRQRYRNGEASAVECVYTFPVPSDATLTGFSMEVGGARVEAVVKPSDEAFRAYDDAVVAGHGAALLEQHRRSVFSATVGNLLPGEDVVVEARYVQQVALDEGQLRLMIPTVVAPRYAAEGAPPLPSPPQGDGAPSATLSLTLDVGREVEVSSPSHALSVRAEGRRVHVSFAAGAAAMDRDLVVLARGAGVEQLATFAAHRAPSGETFVALSVLPDLLAHAPPEAPRDVAFLIDTSGSMEGESIVQARAALRLCLRHLRAGDRFNVAAFASSHRWFARAPVPFDQASLQAADAWVSALQANGGTELEAPLVEAMRHAEGGLVVLLTDGQVSDEQRILAAALAARRGARVVALGIGTAVSDELLRDLARETDGVLELIHPGERIDDKVVSAFSRALAVRVSELTVTFDGVELAELAPHPLRPLVDAEPWTLFAKLERGTTGVARLRGRVGGEAFELDVPISVEAAASAPALPKLWARARIDDLSRVKVDGRRADTMRSRIVELSTAHGVASAYTSFVLVERREGARRAGGGLGATRVVPVSAPAGWAMFAEPQPRAVTGAPAGPPARHRAGRPLPMSAGFPPPPPMMIPSPASPMPRAQAAPAAFGGVDRASAAAGAFAPGSPAFGPASPAPADVELDEAPSQDEPTPLDIATADARSLVAAVRASGLWSDEPTAGGLRENARALLRLAQLGVTTADPSLGGPLKKAITALIALCTAARDPGAAEVALGAAWLVAAGRRTRAELAAAFGVAPALAARVGDERALRAYLDASV